MLIDTTSEILKIKSQGLLERLLRDKTTKGNLLWATDVYSNMGESYGRNLEITSNLITGGHSDIIKNRARKALEQQSERTRQRGEVFTPLWVCAKMNDALDAEWFGREDAFKEHDTKIDFPEGHTWKEYVDRRCLEITCGEAPYLVSRYDVSTGEFIPIQDRIRHILHHQVYGMAPTRIIYLIATNYILGFDERLKNEETKHFVEADAAEAAKNGTLPELVDRCLG